MFTKMNTLHPLLSVCLLLGASVTLLNAQEAKLPTNENTAYQGEEFLLIGNTNRGAGEPVIAVNPLNPNNIVVGAMSSLHHIDGERIPKGFDDIDWNGVIKYRNTPDSTKSVFAISDDRGLTWRFVEDPFRETFKMNGTADACVGFGKDGRLFIGSMVFFPRDASPLQRRNEVEPSPGLLYGVTAIAWSDDDGKTWAPARSVMGQATPKEEYGPGLQPVLLGKTPYDRPFIAVDASTGTLYIPGSGSGGSPPHMETFVRASDDGGQTFGLVYGYDSADYPQSGLSSRPAPANGALGVAYTASAATGAKCPCVVFGLSRDQGKTFTHSVVEAETAVPKGWFGMGSPQITADDSRPGHFAVMTLTEADANMRVYVTTDYGLHWAGPAVAGGTPGARIIKPAIAYSPKGDLGVMWRAMQPDGSYYVWSALSRDGGTRFSRPVQISTAPSPSRVAIRDRGNNWDGDDLSSIALDDQFIHIVWADGRAGFLGTWYARAPFSGFHF